MTGQKVSHSSGPIRFFLFLVYPGNYGAMLFLNSDENKNVILKSERQTLLEDHLKKNKTALTVKPTPMKMQMIPMVI